MMEISACGQDDSLAEAEQEMPMSNDRSREALGRFLDFLGDKGLLSPATAATRKASALKLLSILDADEATDVTKVDVDSLLLRFSNLHGQDYNPTSVVTYGSRLRSVLTDFRAYLENPLSFRPAGQGRDRQAKPKKQNGDTTRTERSTQPAEAPRPQPAPVMAGTNVMPIPIRSDLTILIHGLPHDLTVNEAKKIAGVITALATPS
jgi:hypothetical protein